MALCDTFDLTLYDCVAIFIVTLTITMAGDKVLVKSTCFGEINKCNINKCC